MGTMQERVPYDEFSMFHENAEEFGLPSDGPPVVRRERTDLGDGRQLSSLVWGDADPELVFLHGGAQNADTWDTVALALDRPLVAIDLPGHGHFDGGRHGSLDVYENVDDVATVIRALAPNAVAVIGMSLGGVTTLALLDFEPELVEAAVLVDITPGVTAEKSKEITAFVQGPDSFPSFDDILARTIEHNPTRSESSLRRGILHNAEQREDGTWVWRYPRPRPRASSRCRASRLLGPVGGRVTGQDSPALGAGHAAAIGRRRRRRGGAAAPLSDCPRRAHRERRPQRPGRLARRARTTHRRVRSRDVMI